MESPGARLKNLRLEKGLDLEDVSKKTKVHLNILKAIEEDSVINISPVYLRGFIKIYCNFLGADPRDYIVDYKEPRQDAIKYPVAQDKGTGQSFFRSASIKLISLRSHIRLRIVFIAGALILVVIGLFYLGKVISYKRSRISSIPISRTIPLVQTASKNKAGVISAQTAKPQAATVKAKPSTPSQQKESAAVVRLGIGAKEDCFIELKVDGEVVFKSILKKGRFETWQAKDKMELTLGNAGGVNLQVNGRPISNLGRRGQAIKGILITKEGLSTSR